MSITIGEVIWSSVKPIIKIYLIIGVGFLLARTNVVSVEATRSISNIVLTVLLPCLSFNKIVANIEDKDIKNVGIICLTSVLIFGSGFFAALVCRQFLPVPKEWRYGILAGGTFPNISDLPIAYLQTLDQGLVFTQAEGDKGVASVIIFLAMFMLCVFNLGGFRLIEMDFEYNDEENPPLSPEPPSELEEIKSQVPSPKEAHLGSLHPNSSHDTSSLDSQYSYNQSVASGSSLRSHTLPVSYRQESNIHPIVREYSNVDDYGHEADNTRMRALPNTDDDQSQKLIKFLTNDTYVSKTHIEQAGEILPPWVRKFKISSFVVFFLKNCLRPSSMAVIVALTIAFIPWVKALFVNTPTTPHLRQAPDNQPALSFFMDFTAYVGAASVPFGLLLLGAVLGRLKIGELYPGFWKTCVVLIVLRMCVLPIFGVLWCDRLVKAGWLDWEKDKMLLFVIAITWGLPTMTTMIYFTASYTPLDTPRPVQMECTSFYLMLQYPMLVVSLPFLVTYFIMVQLKV